MLVMNNVEVKYSQVILVLKGISIEVPDGAIVALLGANGAGKTTCLRAISGLLRIELGEVTDGTIHFNGKIIDHMRPEMIVREGISQVLEGRMILEHLTVEENLRLGAFSHIHNIKLEKELDLVYGYFPRLRDLRHRISGFLSGGEQQMCVIGRAMMAKPKLMLLDEPSLGLAPLITEEIFEVVKRFNQEVKMAILLVEQNAHMALDIADYGYVLENGRVVLNGSATQMRDNEDIKEFYLGLSAVGSQRSYREIKHYKRRRRWLG